MSSIYFENKYIFVVTQPFLPDFASLQVTGSEIADS